MAQLQSTSVNGTLSATGVLSISSDINLNRADTTPAAVFTAQNGLRWIYSGGGNYWQTNLSVDSGGLLNMNNLPLATRSWVTSQGYVSGSFLPLSGGTMTGNITMNSKIVIQDGTDGGGSRGIWMWTGGDSNWGIYMGTAGASKSLANGTAPTGIDGSNSHHIRFRIAGSSGNGFIWENNSEQALMSLKGDNGNLYTRGQIYAGNSTSNLVLHAGNYSSYAVARYLTTQTGTNPVKIWNGHLASFSTNSSGNTYTIIQTSVPQDNYQMGGFTLEFFNNYSSTNGKTQIDIAGYWNPEGNGGFIGFEYHTSNPFVTPNIQVARNSSTGNVAFIITNNNVSYQVVVARDLWLGYNSSSDSAWGTGWSIYETSSIGGFTNADSVIARVAAGSDGTNASGTWGINITGNSATTSQTNFSTLTLNSATVATQSWVQSQGYLTSGSFLPLSGGTMTGDITMSGNGRGIYFTGGNNRIYFGGYRALEGNTTGSQLQVGEGYSLTLLQSTTTQTTNLTVNHVYGTGVLEDGRGLVINGNYTNGQYSHRFRKWDDGGGVPLYMQFTSGTANSWSNLVRFGPWSSDGSYFRVFGSVLADSTITSSSDMRAPQFRFTNSTNNAYLTGASDWGFRVVNDNGYIQFGPANGSWSHIYSDKSFYFNQEIYVNNVQVVKNSGTWGINITGNAATVTNGVYTNANNSLTGGNRIVIQASQDGGNSRGIFMWNGGDSNWGIYMAQAGAGKALSDGTAPAGIDGRTEHAIRFRVAASTTQIGFLWENSDNNSLMQLQPNTGNLYTRGQIYAGNSTSNLVWHSGNLTNLNQLSNGPGYITSSGSISGSAGSVPWSGVTGGTRNNYNLVFQPSSNNYAGFEFTTSTGGGGGYFLIRGTSDNDVYTAEGITLVADAGWLTLAQRTTASKGVRIMSGTTSTERLRVLTDGTIQFVNGAGFTYNGNTIWHAGNLTNLNQLSNGPGYITSSALSNYIYTNTGSFTTAGTGWYRVATTGSDGRGTYFVEVYTTGGNHNPSYLKILAHGDWGNDKLVSVETDGGFPASAVRITRGATNTFLEVYFTTTILGASLRVNRTGFDSSVQIYTGALPAGGDTLKDQLPVDSKYITQSISATSRIYVGNGSETLGLIGMGASNYYGLGITSAYTALYGHYQGNGVQLGYYNGSSFTPRLIVANGGDITLTSGTSGTTGKLIFKTSDNADLNKYIMQDGYWTVIGTHSNEGMRVRDSAGNILINIAGSTNGYPSKVGIGNTTPAYKLHVSGDIYADGGWLRVSGTSGLYFESYGGGFRMTGTSYVEMYNGKSLHMGNASIDYTNQLHFNAGTRFYGYDTHYLNFRTDATDYGGIFLRDGNTSIRSYYAYYDGSGAGQLNSSGQWAIRYNGSAETALFYAGNQKIVTLSNGARITGDLYIDDNYGNGIVGLYASTRYQGVFAMGNSYKLAADGTTTGTLYGLAWSHPNAGGVAGNLNTHGLLVMENGTFLAAVSGSIRARDDMRAPIFYDSNNTGYYLDPNSTSNLYYIQMPYIGNGSPNILVNNGGSENWGAIKIDGGSGNMRIGLSGSGRSWSGRTSLAMHVGASESFRVHSDGWDSLFEVWGSSGYARLKGSLEVGSDIYLGTRGNWLSTYLNQAVRTDSSPSFSTISANDVYITGGWFRNHTNNNGIYWSGTGWHIYPADSANMRMRADSSSTAALRMETSGGNVRGYLYANSSNEIGLLNSSGSWTWRVTNSGDAYASGQIFGNGGSFYVGGSSSTWYPVAIGGTGWFPGPATPFEFEIFRADVHTDATWQGTFSAKFKFRYTNCGHANTSWFYLEYRTGSGNYGSSFLGDVANVGGCNGSNEFILWLRGGTTYYFRGDVTNSMYVRIGNTSGTSITDSSGTTRNSISSESTFVQNAKNKIYFYDLNPISGTYYIGDNNTNIQQGGGYSLRINTPSGYLDAGPMNSSYCHFQTDRNQFYFNKTVYIDGPAYRYGGSRFVEETGTWGISITGSAGSVGGIDSSRIVYGDNTTRTKYFSNSLDALSSGFYNQSGASNMPSSSWYHLIVNRHVNEGNNYQLQLAAEFWDSDLWFRKVTGSSGSYTSWRRVIHSGGGTIDAGNLVINNGTGVVLTIAGGGDLQINSQVSGSNGIFYNDYGTMRCNISFASDGDITAYSDIRLKENIEVISNPLDKVSKLRGVTFTRNDKEDKEKRYSGVLAQEVLEVLPEVVSQEGDGYYSVAYGNMVGLLIESIKEQQAQIEDLKSELKELKEKY